MVKAVDGGPGVGPRYEAALNAIHTGDDINDAHIWDKAPSAHMNISGMKSAFDFEPGMEYIVDIEVDAPKE